MLIFNRWHLIASPLILQNQAKPPSGRWSCTHREYSEHHGITANERTNATNDQSNVRLALLELKLNRKKVLHAHFDLF